MPPLNLQQQRYARKLPTFSRKRQTTVTSEEVPACYKIEGLRLHEFPVVGLIVHPRIVPGFFYRVRPLTTSKYLFGGHALQLLSIGQGYGKRITFKANDGDKNGNSNYFWSDSRPEGYGFELEVVAPGDKFTMYDANHKPIGNCEITGNKDAQEEQSHLLWPDGTIEKWVVVRLHCKIESVDGAVSSSIISGNAISSKSTREATSKLIRIMNCSLDNKTHQKGLTLVPGVDSHTRRITVSGSTVSDVPVTYTITGLFRHEFPVIGTFVDQRVLPGFHYIVRPAHAKNAMFGGKALKLLSIGRGYGKRFTFDSDCRNENENYFWSDSYLEGFGFAPHEIFTGMKFKIRAGAAWSEDLGIAIVKKAEKPQVEIEMVILPNGGILKRLRVEIVCYMEVGTGVTRAGRVCGTAVVIRKDMNSDARVERIENPGLDSQLSPNLRHIPGEMVFVAVHTV
ncbi:unnamed protein product [Allacma fusca]|uniref:Uncharacterized protein n=1 Tax=Allacma fusca TaxID=39272 RepID=A0A8J2KGN3_9HEXA|nr:unnamed protein product [Allacma fusca]